MVSHDEGGAPMSETRVTGWVGWVWFAGILLVVEGAFDILFGFMALLAPDTAYFRGSTGALVGYNVQGWGWWMLILGIIVLLTGAFLFRGALWARLFAVIVAGVNAVTSLLAIPTQPIWSLILVAINVMIIYAVTVHGDEVRGR
jgi:hypothetical protein